MRRKASQRGAGQSSNRETFHLKFRVRWRHVLRIDELIRTGKAPNCRRLADDLEVSRRTVLRDIDFLRYDLGAPVQHDPSKGGYVYSEPNWSMPSLRISEGELFAIMVGESALEAYAGTPWAEKLRRVFQRMLVSLPERVEVAPQELLTRVAFDLNAASILSPEILHTVTMAIQKNRTLQMRYFALSHGEEREYVIDPYVLRRSHGAWYLAARDHRSGRVPLFNISRIRQVQTTGKGFDYGASGFDPKQYFGGTFGVHHGEKSFRVVVEFTGFAAQLVRERRWHPSQQLQELPAGALRFHAQVSHLDDVWPWVLSWGHEAVVLAPQELVQIVANESRQMARSYRGNRTTTQARSST